MIGKSRSRYAMIPDAMNHGFDYLEKLGETADGRVVIDYLAHRYPHSSREEWRSRIAAGRVWLDGAPVARPDGVLRRGQALLWRRPPWQEPDAPVCCAILYRDDHLLAVAKPRGLPTTPGGGYLDHTLLAIVRRGHPEAAPLHRLDRGTSGLVLFALTALARERLAASWRHGEVRRIYRGLALGPPAWDRLSIDHPIGPVPHPAGGTVHAVSAYGRPARSEVRVLARRPERHGSEPLPASPVLDPPAETALLEIALETGRPHQIRIHLAAAGHPLLGEPLYGPGGLPREGIRARPGDPGRPEILLHAERLEFLHPATGLPIAILCHPPALLRAPAPDRP